MHMFTFYILKVDYWRCKIDSDCGINYCCGEEVSDIKVCKQVPKLGEKCNATVSVSDSFALIQVKNNS